MTSQFGGTTGIFLFITTHLYSQALRSPDIETPDVQKTRK